MLISLIRTILLYIVILIGVRIMGKRQISQLQTSELVVTLLISELAVMPIQEHDEPILNGLLPIIVLILCEIIVPSSCSKAENSAGLSAENPL